MKLVVTGTRGYPRYHGWRRDALQGTVACY